MILGVLVGNALGFAVALYRQLTPPEASPAGWLNVVLFLVFSVLYAMLSFQTAGERRTTQAV